MHLNIFLGSIQIHYCSATYLFFVLKQFLEKWNDSDEFLNFGHLLILFAMLVFSIIVGLLTPKSLIIVMKPYTFVNFLRLKPCL